MTQPPERWTESSEALSGPEVRASQMLRSARDVEPLTDLQLARVRQRLQSSRAQAPRKLWVGLAAAGIFFVSAASAGWWLTRASAPSLPTMPPVADTSKLQVSPSSAAEQEAGRQPTPTPPQETSSGEGQGETDTVGQPPELRTKPLALNEASAAESTLERASTLERESELVSGAIAALRKRGEPQEALRILTEYARAFPQGILRSEAQLARAEALDALGRSSEALVLLEGLELSSTRLLVLRGNLRAKLGRCASAIEDYDRALAAADAEALYGRASCRARLGQVAAAAADYRGYLQQFPRGRRVERVRQALRDLQP